MRSSKIHAISETLVVCQVTPAKWALPLPQSVWTHTMQQRKQKKDRPQQRECWYLVSILKIALIQAFTSVSESVYHRYRCRVKSSWEATSGEEMVVVGGGVHGYPIILQ